MSLKKYFLYIIYSLSQTKKNVISFHTNRLYATNIIEDKSYTRNSRAIVVTSNHPSQQLNVQS